MRIIFDSEKELEEVVVEKIKKGKIPHLYKEMDLAHVFQQTELGGFGRSDIIAYYLNQNGSTLEHHACVFEIKNVAPQLKDIVQARRYMSSFSDMIANKSYKKNFTRQNFTKQAVLIYPKPVDPSFLLDCHYCNVDVFYPVINNMDFFFINQTENADIPDSELIAPREWRKCFRSASVAFEKMKRGENDQRHKNQC